MKRLWRRPKALVLWMSLASTFALAALSAPGQAAAQGLYSPYGYYPPQPIIGAEPESEPEPEPGISRRDVAAILARHGYRLVGPLRDHGDRIVVSGVDARGRMANFVVDPDEGEILRSWPVGPAFGHGGPDEGFAAPGPYEPMEEGDLGGYGPRERHVHARRNEGEPPDRYARGPRTARHANVILMAPRHARLAMHSAGIPARRVVQHPSPSQATMVRPVTVAAPASTPARPAPPPPGQAQAVTGPPAKTSTSPAPIQPIRAPPSLPRGRARRISRALCPAAAPRRLKMRPCRSQTSVSDCFPYSGERDAGGSKKDFRQKLREQRPNAFSPRRRPASYAKWAFPFRPLTLRDTPASSSPDCEIAGFVTLASFSDVVVAGACATEAGADPRRVVAMDPATCARDLPLRAKRST